MAVDSHRFPRRSEPTARKGRWSGSVPRIRPSSAVSMPRPAGPGRTSPVWASRVISGSAAMEPTGPVQLTTAATRSSVPSSRVTCRAWSPARTPAMVPRWRSSRPALAIASKRRAVAGAMRWRWTSQLRASSAMKRRLSASDRPRHSWAVTGRRPSIAARQSPVASTVVSTWAAMVDRSASRSWMRVTPGGGGTGGVVGSTCGCGTASVRETTCTVRSGRSALIARSTMVRPEPSMSTSPTSGIGCVHGSATSRASSASPAGAQPVPGLLLVASTTARASMRSPSERSTTNPSPASAMSTTSA